MIATLEACLQEIDARGASGRTVGFIDRMWSAYLNARSGDWGPIIDIAKAVEIAAQVHGGAPRNLAAAIDTFV